MVIILAKLRMPTEGEAAMPAIEERIYQPSDLAGTGRKQFVADALRDCARLRTSEGEPLVMLREARLDHVAAIRDYAVAYLTVTTAIKRPRDDRRASDFGDWAFISVFDDEDIHEFLDEVNEAIICAASGGDHTMVASLLHQWKMSARTLSDPVAREILSGETTDADWTEVNDPSDSDESK